jgi:hypothetical protein
MDILIDDAWTEIANNATHSTIISLSATCQHLHKLLKNNELWRYLVNRDHHGVAIHNIGEPYLVQYKYLLSLITGGATVTTAITAAINSGRLDAAKFVFTHAQSELAKYQLSEYNVSLALKIGNLDVLELPPIKSRITTNLINDRYTDVYITNVHVLDWLTTIPINVDIRLLKKIINNKAATEKDLLQIIPWFIHRGISPTLPMLSNFIKSNYKKLYVLLHNNGMSANNIMANACCKLGYLDMLHILKNHGIMPTAEGVYLAYEDVRGRCVLRWLKNNHIPANQKLIMLAIERGDIEILAMFGKSYDYSHFEIARVVELDDIDVFQWMQQQGIIDRLEQDVGPYTVNQLHAMNIITSLEIFMLLNISTNNSLKILELLDSQGLMKMSSSYYHLLGDPKRGSYVINWVTNRVKLQHRATLLSMIASNQLPDVQWYQEHLIRK